ncbi:WD repeat-containing protein 44-like [Telopea speciosissima]|uniref:WD repeat-containing protein 44-like n=1 Tax=Telopea speciosissima TaxID=54955 RepID=UPI001CC81075|nr:WD repeat-containing protein 44-like [Telopea speciosissima]
MADRRLMLMSWGGDDDDQFFESFDRMSSVMAMDMASSGSDDDEDYDDSRMSFASCYSAPPAEFRGLITAAAPPALSTSTTTTTTSVATMFDDYNIWMAEPGSIEERRKKLLKGMGLAGAASIKAPSIKAISSLRARTIKVSSKREEQELIKHLKQSEHPPLPASSPPSAPTLIVRSASDGSMSSSSLIVQQRMKDLLGVSSKRHLLRTASGFDRNPNLSALKGEGGGFVLIKNLKSGKEFIVVNADDDGMWNRVSDLQTGKELTREEFEKSEGYSPNVLKDFGVAVRKVSINLTNLNPIIGKSLKYSKRRGAAWLKNMANSVTGLIGDKENWNKDSSPLMEQPSQSWTKVHQHGKSCKEFTGLYMSQEIQAHQGSIWTIKFSFDTRYLASAGEDRVIHIWEVIECDAISSAVAAAVAAAKSPEEGSTSVSSSSSSSTPIHPMAGAIVTNQPLEEGQVIPLEKKRKGKMPSNGKKGLIQDHLMMSDSVFSLSEKPICSLEGHLDDVLDLSWSISQQLLSSSMDKTVRLWDMESKTCLRVFAHNDYVTCTQFNPVDDRYFISGSLDGKVRLWNIPDRQVVDWTDIHEMVTATCYTPNGQGALVGSHKGSCRLYNTTEYKLDQKGQIDVQPKKKSNGKKITGFEFAPNNPSEVLVTSADSRIRIFDGSDIIHKFIGFRNTSSQISASFTADGKYIVSASEDSQIYVWKRDEIKNIGGGKAKGLTTTRSYEQFYCKDVSVAIAWPGCTKYEPPMVPLQSKRQSKRSFLPPLPPIGASNLNLEDAFMNNSNRKNLPPLPRKNNIVEMSDSRISNKATHFRSDSDISESASFTLASSSLKYGDSPSNSALGNSSSWSSFEGGNSNGPNNCIQATAWGLVVVAAGLDGELKIYQNFGLPVRLSR